MMRSIPIHVLDVLVKRFCPSHSHTLPHRAKLIDLITLYRDNYELFTGATTDPNIVLMKRWFGHLTPLGTVRKISTGGTPQYARPPARKIAVLFNDDIVQHILECAVQDAPSAASGGKLLDVYHSYRLVCKQWHDVLQACRLRLSARVRINSCLPLKFRTSKRSPIELSRLEAWLSSRFVFRPSSVIVDTPSPDCVHTYAHFASALCGQRPSNRWYDKQCALENRVVWLAEVVASINGQWDPGSAPLAALLEQNGVFTTGTPSMGSDDSQAAPKRPRTTASSAAQVCSATPTYCCAVCALCQVSTTMVGHNRDSVIARDRLLLTAAKQTLLADHDNIMQLFETHKSHIDQSTAGRVAVKKNRARQVMFGVSHGCRNGGPSALIPGSWFEYRASLLSRFSESKCKTLLDVWSTLTLETVGIDETKKIHLLAHVLGIDRQTVTRSDTLWSVAKKMHGPCLRGSDQLTYVFCIAKNTEEPQLMDHPTRGTMVLSESARSITVVGDHAHSSVMSMLEMQCGPFEFDGNVYQDSLACTGSKFGVGGVATTDVSILETSTPKALYMFVALAHLFRSCWLGTDTASKLSTLRLPASLPPNPVLKSVIAASGSSLKVFSGPTNAFSAGNYPVLTDLEVTGAWRFDDDRIQYPQAPALRSLRWMNSVPLYVSGLLLITKGAPLLTSLTIAGSGNQKMPDATLSPATLVSIGQSCPHLSRVVLSQSLYQFTTKHAEALLTYKWLSYLHLELRKRVRGTADSESLNPSALRVLLSPAGLRCPMTLSITPSGINPVASLDAVFLGTADAPYRTRMVMVNRSNLFRGRTESEKLNSVDADSLMPGDEAADMRYRQLLKAISDPARRRCFCTNWLQSP